MSREGEPSDREGVVVAIREDQSAQENRHGRRHSSWSIRQDRCAIRADEKHCIAGKGFRSKETYSVALNHFLKTTDPATHRFSSIWILPHGKDGAPSIEC